MSSSLRRRIALIYGGVDSKLKDGGGLAGGESYGSGSSISKSESHGLWGGASTASLNSSNRHNMSDSTAIAGTIFYCQKTCLESVNVFQKLVLHLVRGVIVGIRNHFGKDYRRPCELDIRRFQITCIRIHRIFSLQLVDPLSFRKYCLQRPFCVIKPKSEGFVIAASGNVECAAIQLQQHSIALVFTKPRNSFAGSHRWLWCRWLGSSELKTWVLTMAKGKEAVRFTRLSQWH
jgi:hypothetical protein